MLDALLAMAAEGSDPVKELVLRFLLSYAGIAGGVSFLVEGLKGLFKDKVAEREPVLVIILAFVLGAAAKWLMPDVYGPNTVNAWGLHLLILIFVAVGAAAFHDKFLSVLTSFFPKKSPPPSDKKDGDLGDSGGEK
jgi:hypothetical protein